MDKMIDVGILSYNAHVKKYAKPILWCFKGLFNKGLAQKNGINLFLFCRNDINDDRTINARFFDENDKPYSKVVEFPRIVDNHPFPKNTKLNQGVLDLEQFATFTRPLR